MPVERRIRIQNLIREKQSNQIKYVEIQNVEGAANVSSLENKPKSDDFIECWLCDEEYQLKNLAKHVITAHQKSYFKFRGQKLRLPGLIFYCPLRKEKQCKFIARTKTDMKDHCIAEHNCEPYHCEAKNKGCGYTTKKWRNMTNHKPEVWCDSKLM